MPYRIEYLDDLGGVVTTYWGSVTDEDIRRSGNEKYSNLEKIKSYRYSLTDLSRVEQFDISTAGIHENARLSSEMLDESRQMVVLFVLPTKLEYGMGRMWQAYAGPHAKRSHIFATRGDADRYIDVEINGNGDGADSP